MSKKTYTNKQQKHLRSKGRGVFLPKRKTIFHKSDKDFDRRNDKKAIELELEMDDLDGTFEEGVDEQRSTD